MAANIFLHRNDRWLREGSDDICENIFSRAKGVDHPVRHDEYLINIDQRRGAMRDDDHDTAALTHRHDRPRQRNIAI